MLAKLKSYANEQKKSKSVQFEPDTSKNGASRPETPPVFPKVSFIRRRLSDLSGLNLNRHAEKVISGERRSSVSLHKFATSNTTSGMEVGVASFPQGNSVARGSPDNSARSSPRSNLHVGFAQVGEMKERKEKYLTAKYGAHQMSLIRKRLGVEMWMYDQLQVLYQCPKEGKSEEKEIDLDELLDTEEESCRRKFLQKKLSDCKQSSPDKVEKFINELLERAKTL